MRKEGVVFDANQQPLPGKTGFVDHPKDPGGKTNWGITKRKAREAGYKGLMKDMSYETAKQIYREKDWNLMLGDNIGDQEIAREMLDTGVNIGMWRVIKFLQRVINALNKKATLYPNLKVDGRMGKKTIDTLEVALKTQTWYRAIILRGIDSLQMVRYVELCEKNEDMEIFFPGWARARTGGYS